MASTTQLMPPYSYPDVWCVYNDNTRYNTEKSQTSAQTIGYLFAFVSDKGPDLILTKVTSESERKELFGPTNYKTQGQPYMMVQAALLNGRNKTFVNCIRVLPEDATFAYGILQCYYKANKDTKKFDIKYKFKETLTPVHSDIEFKNAVDSAVDPAEVDGWKVINLLGVRANGRGKFGNNYRWRVVQDTTAEKNYGIKYYNFNIIDSSNGSSSLVGTIYGSAAYATSIVPTVFINDKIVESTEPGKFPSIIYVNETAMEQMYDDYVAFLTDTIIPDNPSLRIPNIAAVDFFFGNKLASTDSDPYINILRTKPEGIESEPGYDPSLYGGDGEELVFLNDAKGFSLSGGSEGAFDTEDAEARQKAINECYIKAYSGVYEECRPVLSSLRTPTTALFDANYDMEVKKVLADLANLRNSSILYLDTGMIPSFSESNVDKLIKDYSSFMRDDICTQSETLPNISINTEWFKVRENDTGRRVAVTQTYFIISNLCKHFSVEGFHIPFAQARAILNGHVTNSVRPCVDVWEKDLQEKLNEARINYFVATGDNEFRRATQNIAQYINSDLIEESHVHIAYYLSNHISADARDRLYDFADADARDRFSSFVERKYADLVGSVVQSLAVRFEVSAWEEQRHIVHGYIDIVFRQLGKQYILEFNINSRDTTTETITTL